ncbi:phasin family protein [Modicisalibacter tunisiensis]|uniref:phasin family protein n=1 Tax=Modicisalibacter TaxID=574347 RepID=UPI0013CF670F|nr:MULTISPECIES: phasin family protein [Modicisalibacter]MBZ9538774.1 phasin family protein [Modicisalibacter tunisiensis]
MATNTQNAFDQVNKQFETLYTGPARAYASMAMDYAEQLVNTQMGFAKAYVDASFAQTRAMLDVRDADGFRNYVEEQQKVVKDLGERLKGDAEKVVALNQDFAKQSQQLVEENLKTAGKTAGQTK